MVQFSAKPDSLRRAVLRTFASSPAMTRNNATKLDGQFGQMDISSNKPRAHDSDDKIIIALDFGTTFSGIAYSFPNQEDTKVTAIMDWPGLEGESVPKTPTLIQYDKSGSFKWGAAADSTQGAIVGVKLLLDPSQEQPHYLPSTNVTRDIKNLPKQPVAVAADFIQAIYKHAQREIEKTVPGGYLRMCKKEFVLSVPAVWSDEAKHATMSAAKQAGIFPVTLIKEPEAAALYTMHSLDFALKVGDAFVVCDAGGGTVDLISYEVTATTPKLQLKELVPGSGGMAGSLGLNKRFAEAVNNLVGDDQFHKLRKTKAFALAEKYFDRDVKKAFRGKKGEEYFVNFPMAGLKDDKGSGLESNCWRLTQKTLDKIFAPIITDILRLIDHQVQSVQIKRGKGGLNGIFLVGGFGSSQYLKHCVEKNYPQIKILQPTDAWAAIEKGAVLSQLPQKAAVVSTCATKHYGVDAYEVPDRVLDAGETPVERLDGTFRVPVMTWYINIGDDIVRDQEIRLPFARDLEADYSPADLVFTDELYECSDREAPRHMHKGRVIGPNCTLVSDLKSIDKKYLSKRKNPKGATYYEVAYYLVVTLKSALMEFSLEIDGKKMGSVKANFGNN